MRQASKADAVRALLLGKERLTAAEIARKTGTTTANVYNIKAEMKRRGKSLPKAAPKPPAAESNPAPAAPAPASEVPASHEETQPVSPAAGPAGLEFVAVKVSHPAPAVSEEPTWACDKCNHKGSGKPPASCPKCGGA